MSQPLFKVRNVPSTTPVSTLRLAFGTRDVKGILVRYRESHGIVFLAYYDVRSAASARRTLQGKTLVDLLGLTGDESSLDSQRTPLIVQAVTAQAMEKMIGPSEFVAETDGAFVVSVENRVVQPADMQQLLASFGELMSFSSVATDNQTQVRLVLNSDAYMRIYSSFSGV